MLTRKPCTVHKRILQIVKINYLFSRAWFLVSSAFANTTFISSFLLFFFFFFFGCFASLPVRPARCFPSFWYDFLFYDRTFSAFGPLETKWFTKEHLKASTKRYFVCLWAYAGWYLYNAMVALNEVFGFLIRI